MPTFEQDPISKSSKGTKSSFITDLINHAGQYGFQKSNRFIVFIAGPTFERYNRETIPNDILNKSVLQILNMQRLALTCIDASLPGRLISTEDIKLYNINRKIPNFETFTNQLTLTFIASTDMFERMYFKSWQDRVMNPLNNSPGFYQDYAQRFIITIMVLPDNINSFSQITDPYSIGNNPVEPRPYDSNSSVNGSLYFIKCLECYPLEISEIPVSSNNSDFMRVSVTFAFKKWVDPVEQYYRFQLDNAQSDLGRSILERDPAYTIKDDPTLPYADRGNVLNERMRDLTEDRVGSSDQDVPPWQKFIKYTRDIVRNSNPKELRQLLVDEGISILGKEFGLENVEYAAQAGQIIDVFRRSPEINLEGLRTKLLDPILNIGNINPPNTGIRNVIGGLNINNIF